MLGGIGDGRRGLPQPRPGRLRGAAADRAGCVATRMRLAVAFDLDLAQPGLVEQLSRARGRAWSSTCMALDAGLLPSSWFP